MSKYSPGPIEWEAKCGPAGLVNLGKKIILYILGIENQWPSPSDVTAYSELYKY